MGCTVYGDYEFVPIRSSETCPICGSRKGRCSMYVKRENGQVIFYRCKYKESSKPSNGWYIHMASDVNGTSTNSYAPTYVKLDDYKQTSITEEDLILWDKVYRQMREILHKYTGSYLYPEHLENLTSRGFSESEIRNMGFFSVPRNNTVHYSNYTCSLKTAIVNELLEIFKGDELLKVPGFFKGSKNGNDFVTFKNSLKNAETGKYEDLDGYFIPYHSPKGLLVGMQFRLTKVMTDEKGKPVRYLWYTTRQNSCGSPIDYYVPMQISMDDVILVCEGATKTKFAATKMQLRSLAEAGVGNYKNLVKNLQEIEKLENKKYKVLLALDMDKCATRF